MTNRRARTRGWARHLEDDMDPYNNVGDKAAPKNVRRLPVVKKAAPADPTQQWPVWSRIRKIVRLGGWNSEVKVDPIQVLGGTLEKAKHGRIKSVFLSIMWDDDSLAVDWSQMKSSEMVSHAFNIQAEVQQQLRNKK